MVLPITLHSVSQRLLLRPGLALALTGSVVLATPSLEAASPAPRVVDVPSTPAFIKPPQGGERPARSGQTLPYDAVLRTQKPGRMQVQLPNGRSFRLGGDAVLRLGRQRLDLQRGQIIAWVNPGAKGGSPVTIQTRMATASIVGTTVFIEATDTGLKIFSWEGEVACTTHDGQRKTLRSGEQLAYENGTWAKTRLTPQEAAARRQKSILLNGFSAPMETLPVLEKELGISTLVPAR
ncbi:FecR domain-containing protein [Cyanobium sp. T1B-Tous]|uniref:FecR family protein n=1 Tax=Cyanobium sp. T1B-Tous TaxID=2823721 RepID=UPI0020CD93EE|nr:FecR family protein [Cyanobium sp. T1B-Tous]MCP9807165.1 FecR domain-containing protein [Cyanobium sp. T1B-Tous]